MRSGLNATNNDIFCSSDKSQTAYSGSNSSSSRRGNKLKRRKAYYHRQRKDVSVRSRMMHDLALAVRYLVDLCPVLPRTHLVPAHGITADAAIGQSECLLQFDGKKDSMILDRSRCICSIVGKN